MANKPLFKSLNRQADSGNWCNQRRARSGLRSFAGGTTGAVRCDRMSEHDFLRDCWWATREGREVAGGGWTGL